MDGGWHAEVAWSEAMESDDGRTWDRYFARFVNKDRTRVQVLVRDSWYEPWRVASSSVVVDE